MASSEPTEEEIMQVIDFANLNCVDDRFMVTNALKSNSRNVESVVMQYFDNPTSFEAKYQSNWNEEFFTADRDGNNSAGISFHIESPGQNEVIQGVTPPQSYTLTAPSRPPSRSNNRSPLGNVVNWTAQASGAPNSQAEEDEDIQRAIRESAQEAGIDVPEIETGVTEGPSAPSFGPANRPEYDQGTWAMIPTSPTKTALTTAPVAAARRRQMNGAPSFLVQGYAPAPHSLGGLMTILHEIPIARNLFLASGKQAASYGHNSEWWKGQEILPPHVLAQLQSGELQWGRSNQSKPDFDEELHRLMAFLDSTERSYGTVSVLNDIIPTSSLGPEKQFYEHFATRNSDIMEPLMQVAALAEVGPLGQVFDTANFGILEIELLRSEYDVCKTLYEALDHVVWNDILFRNEMDDDAKIAMFRQMGEVFALKVGGDGPADSFEIPEVLYPERWMESRKDEARQILRGWVETKQWAKLADLERNNILFKQQTAVERLSGNTAAVNKREMINKSTEQWKSYAEYLEGLSRFHSMESSGFQTSSYPNYRAAPCDMSADVKEHYEKVQGVVKYSESLLADLEARLKGLQVDLEHIQIRQRFLGKLLTDPDKPGRSKPMTCKKYLLRGLAAPNDTVYVCRRAEKDLIEFDDQPKRLDQWWRLAYRPREEPPVQVEKIEIERALREVWQETKTPLFIYATEEALNTPRDPLTSQLKRFVKAENKAFHQELNRELNQDRPETQEKRKPGVLDPLSPSKRHRSDSPDSMDSNRASLGSLSDVERNAFSFAGPEGSIATEMTGMSANNEAWSAGMGSPKEPPPALPSRRPGSPADTSATMTPRTVTAESGERDIGALLIPDEVEYAKPSPEVREHAQPPYIVAGSRSEQDARNEVNIMDMDIEEEKRQ